MKNQIFEVCYQRYINAKPGEQYWDELAEQFNYKDGESLRQAFKAEREKREIPSKGSTFLNEDAVSQGSKNPEDYVDKVERDVSGDGGESRIVMNFPAEKADFLTTIFETQNKTDEDMLRFHGFDVDVWAIDRVRSNAWHMPSGAGQKIICFQSRINIIPKNLGKITLSDVRRFFSELELKPFIRDIQRRKINYGENGFTLEINLADMHIGKVSSSSVDGTDNVEEEIRQAVRYLYEKVKNIPLNKVIITGLGDIFHYDTKKRTTTRGTPVNTDGRTPAQIYKSAVLLLIDIIDLFSLLAPVEYVHVSGNHDFTTAYYLAETLAYNYKDVPTVKIDTEPQPRKFRMIGDNLIGWTHGDVNKQRLQKNFLQVDAREEWGIAKTVEIHVGNFHHEESKEEGGLVIRWLSAISDTDEWHDENLFIGSKRAITSFLWHEKFGLDSIIFSNISY